MKRYKLKGCALLAGLSLALSALPAAADSVRQLSGDTLQVVDFQGKPPFKRRTVSAQSNPAEFARLEALRDAQPRPLFASEQRGAPGKNLPRQSQRVSSEPGELAEFARFEESAEPSAASARHWRGAPGKGRPRQAN